MFTAGGVAAGKSTAVSDTMVASSDLVFDGTLRETPWAIQTIEHAIAKGWKVEINYVQRPIDLVIKGAIDRADKSGRWGSIADLPSIHQDAQKSIIDIAEHFEGNPSVGIDFWLNDGTDTQTPPQRLTLADIDTHGKYSYQLVREEPLDEAGTGRRRQDLPREFRQEGREAVLSAFTDAVHSGRYSQELLSRLAQGDTELEGILSQAKPHSQQDETSILDPSHNKERTVDKSTSERPSLSSGKAHDFFQS